MGANGSRVAPPTARVKHQALDGKDAPVPAPYRKILLLGGSESGKTTIFKQMQIIFEGRIPKSERVLYEGIIFENLFSSLRTILGYRSATGTSLVDFTDDYREIKALVSLQTLPFELPSGAAMSIHRMWRNTNLHFQLEEKPLEPPLMDSAEYFLDEVLRFRSSEYRPSEKDVLKACNRTTGIYSKTLSVDNIPMQVFDVGGNRSQRKKWKECMGSNSIIIFCAALSEYNETLWDYGDVNRLDESLTLFDHLVNSQITQTSFILLLTKADIFKKKIKQIPLSDYLPAYTGGTNFENGVQYMIDLFLDLNKNGLHVYVHVLDATDTPEVKAVFENIQKTVLSEN